MIILKSKNKNDLLRFGYNQGEENAPREEEKSNGDKIERIKKKDKDGKYEADKLY
jgi:anti-sigma28 factor (negative regulator of flagellin synthesis)